MAASVSDEGGHVHGSDWGPAEMARLLWRRVRLGHWGWMLYEGDDEAHVWPVRDQEKHCAVNCPCEPVHEYCDQHGVPHPKPLVIHFAWDGRL